MPACAWRSSLTICFSAVWVNSMRQVKSALQLFQADGGFVALQDGDAKKVVLAVFEILPNGSDATAVRGHAIQDRGAALASAVGERLVDADFGDEGGMKG